MHSFELEEITQAESGLEFVVIGEIKAIKKHPDADRLQIAKVNLGKQILDLVCGAPNIVIGQKVPVSLEGAELTSGITIRETEIRGVKSKGMLCSQQDLGIGEDHAGIYILSKKAKIGENLGEFLKLNDTQIQLDVLANRGHDALSHIGMAREICANEGRKLKSPPSLPLQRGRKSGFSVKIEDQKLCRRYIGVEIENIEVKASPQWMQARLKVCGVRPINNLVDITNFVMLELGQPMHAFDAEKTTGKIVVRKAKKNEKLKLLDEKEYILGENNLVIADSEKALALAGVMGGMESGVANKTTSIILESANFDPVNIRKTRTMHNIITDASHRFERDLDPNLTETAAARAIELIKKFGGKNVKVVAVADVYSKKMKSWQIRLNADYVKSLLGENISEAKMKNILENLDIKVKISGKYLNCEIPTIRLDLKTQEDLIEEIGRIYGYENIAAKAPTVELSSPVVNEQRVFEDKLRNVMTALGFSEMLNYSFYSKDDVEKCGLGIEGNFEVANPMNPDQQYMRRSMIPNLLKNVKLNLKNFEKFKIFEIGRKFRDEGQSLPSEISILAGALVDVKNGNPYFELKRSLDAALEKFGSLAEYRVHTPKYKSWQIGRVAEIWISGKKIGKIGEINPLVRKEYGISSRVALFGVGIVDLLGSISKEKTYKSISKFPSVKRDISMFVAEKTTYSDIESKVYSAGGKLVLDVELFDIFEKEGEKSMALRVEIGSREKTLTSEEIDGVMKKIVERLEKDLKVKVRK
jgi:phenylalanyl-tRNA synthetase beta chain